MKKQIKRIFHNMIGKEQKIDWQSVHQVENEAAQENKSGGMTGEENRTGVQSGSINLTVQDAFDKVTDQKGFERTVNDMLCAGQNRGCMLISDLDRFKDINAIYGRNAGNALLRSAVNTLCDHFGQCTCIGRQAGDIFTLWIPEMDREDADYIRFQVGRVNDRLLHPGKEVPPVSVSIGVAFYKEGDDCHSLGKRANKMLYRVKESGRCGCEIETAS